MRPLLFFFLIVLTGCGSKNSSVHYGQTTVADLIKEKGAPQAEQKVPVKENKILIYPDSVKYQVRGDVIISGFRNPETQEKSLLYWKHKFRKCQFVERQVSAEEKELACPAEGVSIIFGVDAEFVSKVVEYEKK